MKNNHGIVSLLLALVAGTTALGADNTAAGPKGGRLLETEPHQAEFFVTQDRRVEITFYDAALQPVAPGPQVVTVTAELPDGRAQLDMEKTATGFVSKAALPAGEPYRMVVQVRAKPGAKPQNVRIDLNLAVCSGCSHAEYACSCPGH